MIKRISELQAHGIQFEDIWIDAAWYGDSENCESAYVGDWWEQAGNRKANLRVHPDGFSEVAKAAEKTGIHLMLWFEPERAITDTSVTLEHPEWFITRPNDKANILYYGNEEALQYMYGVLSSYVEKLHLSCYRQDFNSGLTHHFQHYDKENRVSITEIKHITGMYRLWDMLHERFPDLLIDNCASVGRRFDIETLKRSIAFFRSDYQCNFNANSDILQVHNANSSLYLPYMGCTSKTKSDTYAIRSFYCSSWGGAFYNTIFQSMEEADFVWAKHITDEYRKLRKYFSKNFYNHGSACFDETAWAIFPISQYHDEETNSGIIMAFRRGKSPFDQVEIQPKGLFKNAAYTYTNLDDGSILEGEDKLRLILPEQRSSMIVAYSMKKE